MSEKNQTLHITPQKQTPWFALPVIVGLVLTIVFVSQKVRFILTESVDARIVWEVSDYPTTGDLVSFDLTNPVVPTPDNTVKVTKMLVCSEGQHLLRDKDTWFCDGHELGTNRVFAINGDKLQQFHFQGKIPANKGFVMGDGQNSFDSRYWGFVDLDKVTTVAKVI